MSVHLFDKLFKGVYFGSELVGLAIPALAGRVGQIQAISRVFRAGANAYLLANAKDESRLVRIYRVLALGSVVLGGLDRLAPVLALQGWAGLLGDLSEVPHTIDAVIELWQADNGWTVAAEGGELLCTACELAGNPWGVAGFGFVSAAGAIGELWSGRHEG